jgi:glycosyltransferase involved in cell wall biosynthesis
VICNSRFTSASVTRLFDPVPPPTVIHPPVTPIAGGMAPAERALLRRTLDTAAGDAVLVTACRSEAWKGHETIVRALTQLRDLPGWTWWQIGGAQRPAERSYLNGIKQLAARHGIDTRVRWLGERNDVPALLRGADVYCQPNASPEPFGIAFVEALSASLPVVTSDFGGAREIVDSSCGLLVPPRDQAALAAALKQLIEDPALRARLADGGPLRARTLCDPASRLRELDQALAGVSASQSDWLAVAP